MFRVLEAYRIMWYKSLFDTPGMTMKLSNAAVLLDDERTPHAGAYALPMFPLDMDEDLATTLDGKAFTQTTESATTLSDAMALEPREESYIGKKPQASVADAVRERHTTFVQAVSALESVCATFDSVDMSAVAAQTVLRRRVGSLSMLGHALEGVASFVENPDTEVLFGGEGLLAPYLAGIYLWAGDVTETLATLAHDLNTLAPNWGTTRERLNDVVWIFAMALAEGRRLENDIDVLPVEMHQALGELLVCAIGLKHKLDEPFG